VEFELKYTSAQDEFRNEVRTWLAANVPDGITARPRNFDESRAIYLLRRELGRKLGAKGWLYPSGEKQYGGGGLELDQIIVLEEEAVLRQRRQEGQRQHPRLGHRRTEAAFFAADLPR
jgi:alkylation response protein AidB-like acyl-CoA dehydrogenase